MIRLSNAANQSLEIVTSQNGADFACSYSDASSGEYGGNSNYGSVASATTTTISPVPGSGAVRDVDYVNIKNTYAGPHVVTIQVDNNGANVPLVSVELAAGESLNYTHGSGWQVKETNGATKVTASNIINNTFNTGAPGAEYLVKVAGEALGGHRMVVLNSAGEAIYADSTIQAHLHKVLGMTVGAASLGANINILRMGELAEPSWTWTLDQPIFLGTAGNLTQTPPTSGFSLVVAFPISATSAYVDLREPINL